MRARLWTVVALLGLVAAIGCFDRNLTQIRPTTSTGVTIKIEQVGAVKVDIITLVDNSNSMQEEQVELVNRFPELIAELIDPPDTDGDTHPDHPPVEDINIGVVDSDMGTMGYTVPTCINSNGGDQGCFKFAPSAAVGGCAASYPRFLSRNPGNAAVYDAATMEHDFACIATLGTGGCGFEQHLKAMREAVTTDMETGGCNEGFLRSDAVLALLFIGDEDDCSVLPEDSIMFDQGADLGNLNVRCYLHPDMVTPVEQYLEAFRALKPADKQDNIVVGMIVGVPKDAPQCQGSGDMLTHCLDGTVPEMLGGLDPVDSTKLAPVCTSDLGTGTPGVAYPGFRFVSLAKLFGASAYVDSICKGDWTGAINGILKKLVDRIPSTCFPHELTFDTTSCTADCSVIETLSNDRPCAADPSCSDCPPATVNDVRQGTLEPCTNAGGECEPLKRDLGYDENGQRLCLVRQAARPSSGGVCGAPTSDGWYYAPPIAAAPPAAAVCPQLIFSLGGSGSLIEDNSTAVLQCLSALCPPERQCGPTGDPLDLTAHPANPSHLCCEGVSLDHPYGMICDPDNPPTVDNDGACIDTPQ